MSLISGITQTIRKTAARRGPRLLKVKEANHLTPNMIRVTFAGPELEGFPEGCEGGNCKIMLPDSGETLEHFSSRLDKGPAPPRRTYTVRHYRAATQELDIDFVAHGDNGPASRWATNAAPGDFLAFMGPSGPKVAHFEADWYLVAADLSALPVAAAALEAMPRNARGVAVFEVTSAEDQQTIDAPEGIDINWLVHPEPHRESSQQLDFIRALDWPDGRVQTCIAGESGAIKSLRRFLTTEKSIAKKDLYISGYWKVGLIEDEHQQLKRSES